MLTCSVTAGGQPALMYAGPGSGPMLAAAAGSGGWPPIANHGVHLRRFDHWPGRRAMAGPPAASRHVTGGAMRSNAGRPERPAQPPARRASASRRRFSRPCRLGDRGQQGVVDALLATNFLARTRRRSRFTEAQYAESGPRRAAMYLLCAGVGATQLMPFNPAAQTNPAGLASQAAFVCRVPQMRKHSPTLLSVVA